MKHHIKYDMYKQPTMQCNIKKLDDVKFSNFQPLAITHDSLNCHRLLDLSM